MTSGGNTVAQPSTVVTLAAGTDTTVTLTVPADELEGFDASGDFSLSSVNLLDMTDDTLTSIDSATPALTGTLAPADVEYSACSVGLEGSAPTSADTVELSGEAVSRPRLSAVSSCPSTTARPGMRRPLPMPAGVQATRPGAAPSRSPKATSA